MRFEVNDDANEVRIIAEDMFDQQYFLQCMREVVAVAMSEPAFTVGSTRLNTVRTLVDMALSAKKPRSYTLSDAVFEQVTNDLEDAVPYTAYEGVQTLAQSMRAVMVMRNEVLKIPDSTDLQFMKDNY